MKDVNKKWERWAASRNENGGEKVPLSEELLRVAPKKLLQYLSMFIAEVRGENGECFSKKSLIRILSMIRTYINDNKKDASDSFKQELNIGVRRITKGIEKAPPMITTQIERKLWEKCILDTESNNGLSNAMFFYNVKIFGLTSVTDHQLLKRNAFEFSENAFGKYVQLNCDGFPSKTAENLPCKVIHYEDVGNARSYYKLLQKYLHAISKCKTNNFYVRPHHQQSKGFTNQIFGNKALSHRIRDIMRMAGYSEEFGFESLGEYYARRSATSSHSILKKISKKLDPPYLQPIKTSAKTQPIKTRAKTQPIKTRAKTQPIKTRAKTRPIKTSAKTQPITTSAASQLITISDITQPIKMETSEWDLNRNTVTPPLTMIQTCSLTVNLKGSFHLSVADLLPPGTTVKPKGIQIMQQTEGQVTVKMDVEHLN